MKSRTFQEKLNESLTTFRDNPAVEYGNRILTYDELDRQSNRIARWMVENGIRKERFAGILAEDKILFILTLTAAIKAGAVFVPLDSANPDERLQQMINIVKLEVLFIDKDSFGKYSSAVLAKGENIKPVIIEDILETNDLVDTYPPGISYSPGDRLYVFFTSGTTGAPRAVVGKNISLLHYCRWEVDAMAIDESFRLSQFSSVGFDAILKEVFVTFFAGGTLCVPQSLRSLLNPDELIDWVEKSRIHLIHCVPPVFRLLNSPRLTGNNFESLKYILLSGDKIYPKELKQWYDIFDERIQLVNLYGATETTILNSYYPIRKSDVHKERIPIGKPMKGCRMVVLDEDMKPCNKGMVGEIYIRTPYRTFGYMDAPELNREKFIQNPFSKDPHDIIFKTGDLGRFLFDENLEFLGRRDRQVKIRGIRIELEEIEWVLMQHPSVKEVAVVKKERSPVNELLYGYFTGNGVDAADMEAFLSGKLPSYMVPGSIVEITEMPRNPNGKIDYKKLLGISKEETFTIPRDEVESKVREFWSEILEMDKEEISVTRSFFELGGNSLSIMSLISKIHREFDIQLAWGEIFNHPRVREQAELVKGAVKCGYPSIEPVEEKTYYPLSSAQKRMYIAQQLETESTSYNMATVLVLTGEIDRERLEQTFKELIRRHEILRTSFRMVEDKPVQVVHDFMDIDFALQYHEAEEGTVEIEKQAADFIRPFDLEKTPLLRVRLMRTGEGQHLLLVDMYHIISDGYSYGVLVGDFTALYNGRCLPSLNIQYRDFCRWENRLFESEELRKQEEYWLDRFNGYIPVLKIPGDYPRPPVRSFDDGDIVIFTLEAELARELVDLARESGATPFIFLLAVYNVLLFKYTGQEDIVVGSPVTGRSHPDLQGLIGVFLNMLPMRNHPRKDKTFKAFLAEVRENSFAAFRNQDYPFEEMVSKLGIQGDASRNPLFDTEFAIGNFETPELEIPGLKLQLLDSGIKFAKFDLHFLAVERGDTIEIKVRYYTALFEKSTVERMVEHYIEIIRQVVENMEVKLEDITLSLDLEVSASNILEEAKGDFGF